MILTLDDIKKARLERQAKRFEQTVEEYIWSWVDCGLRSDEDDDTEDRI